MKKLVFSVIVMSWVCWQLQGCAGKTAVRVLEDAAKLATGPCLDKVAEAAATCKTQYDTIKAAAK